MAHTDEHEARSPHSWSGDAALIAARRVLVSELLCEAVHLRAHYRVLDVATGHGNTALAAARRGCDATGIDLVPELLAQARRRAAAEGLPALFHAGDATRIPFAAGSFHIVLCTFGPGSAADTPLVVQELLRVCRPGGKIGLAAWASTGADVVERRIVRRYLPTVSETAPRSWGTPEGLAQLFGPAVVSLQVTPRQLTYHLRSVAAYVDTLQYAPGPCRPIFAGLDADTQQRFRRDLIEGMSQLNRSGDETLVLPFDYLEAVATRR